MDRKLIVVAVCALTALSAAASAAFGQEQKKAVPKLHVMHATKAVKAETGEAVKNEVAAMGASKKSGLPLFTYTIQSDRDGQQYTGVIVGADPTSKGGNKSTSVKTFIVPVIVVTQTVGTGLDANNMIVTAPGVTTFDPTKNDNSCLAAPNNNPLKLFQQSPIFQKLRYFCGRSRYGSHAVYRRISARRIL